jgi:hypothetical protein
MSLFVTISSGCIVLDEIDAAAAKMPTKKAKVSTAAATPTASTGAQQENPILEQSKKWWKEATSLGPSGIDSSIVTCRIGQSTQFMSKDDCLTRGGVPRSASG